MEWYTTCFFRFPSRESRKARFRPYSCVFHPIWVLGAGEGGGSQGMVHHLLVQFFTLGSSKIKVFKTYYFDTVIT